MKKLHDIECRRCAKKITVTDITYRKIKSNPLWWSWLWCGDCERSFKEAKLFIDKEIENPRKSWEGVTVYTNT